MARPGDKDPQAQQGGSQHWRGESMGFQSSARVRRVPKWRGDHLWPVRVQAEWEGHPWHGVWEPRRPRVSTWNGSAQHSEEWICASEGWWGWNWVHKGGPIQWANMLKRMEARFLTFWDRGFSFWKGRKVELISWHWMTGTGVPCKHRAVDSYRNKQT